MLTGLRDIIRQEIEKLDFLSEATRSTHFDDRLSQRFEKTIAFNLPQDFFEEGEEGEEKHKITLAVRRWFEEALSRRISLFAGERYKYDDIGYIVQVGLIRIKRNGKFYKPVIKALVLKKPKTKKSEAIYVEQQGDYYYSIIYNDTVVTFILKTTDHVDIESTLKELPYELIDRTRKHAVIKEKENTGVSMYRSKFKPELVIDYDEMMNPSGRSSVVAEPEPKIKKILPKKANYKKGAPYVHPRFGRGEIETRKKVSDGVFDVTINFPPPFNKKVIRLSSKELDKPAEDNVDQEINKVDVSPIQSPVVSLKEGFFDSDEYI